MQVPNQMSHQNINKIRDIITLTMYDTIIDKMDSIVKLAISKNINICVERFDMIHDPLCGENLLLMLVSEYESMGYDIKIDIINEHMFDLYLSWESYILHSDMRYRFLAAAMTAMESFNSKSGLFEPSLEPILEVEPDFGSDYSEISSYNATFGSTRSALRHMSSHGSFTTFPQPDFNIGYNDAWTSTWTGIINYIADNIQKIYYKVRSCFSFTFRMF